MLVKFFSRGSGGGDSPVDYLLGEDREREGASILRGNAEITKELINSTDYARRYTSGCLSFEEAPDAVTDKTKAQIMDIFEQTIFAGLESDQYNILWVEHTDKDLTDKNDNVVKDREGKAVKRLELNFLIPNQELRSGKRLQPFFHGADLKRVNAYQNAINMQFKFSDPHDPSKRRSHNPYFSRDANLKGVEKKDYTEEQTRLTTHHSEKNDITAYMYDLAARGKLQSRQAMQDVLKRQGYQVERVTRRSISVSTPKFTKNIRLDDPIFSEDFKPYDYISLGLQEKQRRYEQEKTGKILKDALVTLNEGIKIKSEYHAERFGGADIPKPFELGLEAPVSAQAHLTEPKQQPKPTEQDNSPSMGF